LGLYGHYTGFPSLKWELTQQQREVSAEWTIRGRDFVAPTSHYGTKVAVGLLVKSQAVIRKTRCDIYSCEDGGTLRWRRRGKLDPSKYATHLWEAVCFPRYAGIVVVLPTAEKSRVLDEVMEASKVPHYGVHLPVLIYSVRKNSNSGPVLEAPKFEML
jgi:hypothetical protein